jgi:Formyltetrahydrofolate synthetase
MKDIEISHSFSLRPVSEIAKKLGVKEEFIEPYGKYKAKITSEPPEDPRGKIILVTATNPTPYGEGKTTVSIGLADAIARLGKKVSVALREPSLGPVFGVKGGATGGGYSQVAPMEDINLHFTGDFHAITSANNLLSALVDNHIKQGNALKIDINKIEWRRCLDLNDRALREITVGEGGEVNGAPRKDGFSITAASEIMAILCLSKDLSDLKRRLGNIVIGQDLSGKDIAAADLQAADSMAILLKDAIFPNLVQTLGGTPAIIHGGPFANIAHGCNSIRATRLSASLSDYTVTEAGFGADLGAEKFLDIKCRLSGLIPSAVVIVTTVRALKHNGGGDLKKGLPNLIGHIRNLKEVFGVKLAVAINKYIADTEAELNEIKGAAASLGVKAYAAECWAKGGEGAIGLAEEVVGLSEGEPKINFAYPLEASAEEKIDLLATRIYGAKDVVYSGLAKEKLGRLDNSVYKNLPVCVAKTQYSFSSDPALLGKPENYSFTVRDVLLRAGAGFIVAVAGNIMLMPGLPLVPAAVNMKIDGEGKIEGLF